ncbi:AAA family ATPase, partial [Paenibacillus xylanexedens]|uniref:AAA family ATPase n=1 Tax=Paenibacillus xylanexedens TaxID=528191 RepID=UPI001642F538
MSFLNSIIAFLISLDNKNQTKTKITPHLTPTSIYQPHTPQFNFRPRPLISNILLPHQINPPSPPTHSPLLHPIHQPPITLHHTTYPFPPPFFLLPTHNPFQFH